MGAKVMVKSMMVMVGLILMENDGGEDEFVVENKK